MLLADFLDLKPPPVAHLIGRGILPVQSLCLLGAPPKSNKSFVALNLLMAIASGKHVFGAKFPDTDKPIFPVTKAHRVQLIEQELGVQTLQKRLHKLLTAQGITPSSLDVDVVSRDTGMRLDTQQGRDYIEGHISVFKPDIICLDPLKEFQHCDENSNQEMGIIVAVLKGWMQRYKCSFMVVHHEGHTDPRFPRTGGDRLRGATALWGAADTIINITRKSASNCAEPRLMLEFELRHDEPTPPVIVKRMESGDCKFEGFHATQDVR